MLRSEEHLKSKEYPLVLDGPFSKLDSDQRQNVVNMLPTFAPQVILFSKDDLHGVFAEENIGRVWTIVSNDEKVYSKKMLFAAALTYVASVAAAVLQIARLLLMVRRND